MRRYRGSKDNEGIKTKRKRNREDILTKKGIPSGIQKLRRLEISNIASDGLKTSGVIHKYKTSIISSGFGYSRASVKQHQRQHQSKLDSKNQPILKAAIPENRHKKHYKASLYGNKNEYGKVVSANERIETTIDRRGQNDEEKKKIPSTYQNNLYKPYRSKTKHLYGVYLLKNKSANKRKGFTEIRTERAANVINHSKIRTLSSNHHMQEQRYKHNDNQKIQTMKPNEPQIKSQKVEGQIFHSSPHLRKQKLDNGLGISAEELNNQPGKMLVMKKTGRIYKVKKSNTAKLKEKTTDTFLQNSKSTQRKLLFKKGKHTRRILKTVGSAVNTQLMNSGNTALEGTAKTIRTVEESVIVTKQVQKVAKVAVKTAKTTTKAAAATSKFAYKTVRNQQKRIKALRNKKVQLSISNRKLKMNMQGRPAVKFKKTGKIRMISRDSGIRTRNQVVKRVEYIKFRYKAHAIQRYKDFAKAALRSTKAVIKETLTTVGKALARRVLALAGLGILFITVISMLSSISNFPFSTIMTDEKTIEKYQVRMKELEEAFQAEIDSYMNDPDYDDHVLNYMNEEGIFVTNWKEVLCIMAVQFEQNMEVTREKLDYMENIFQKMNKVKTHTESYICPGCKCPGHKSSSGGSSGSGDGTHGKGGTSHTVIVYCHPGCECPGHMRIIVDVYTYGMEDIINELDWTADQKEWARNLVTIDMKDLFPGLEISISGGPNGGLTQDEIDRLLENAPTSSASRQKIVSTALSLVGKVPYFWGGKSSPGWNNKWGTQQLVTASGDGTTGTYQPYGLDCSGFTDWVYRTAGVGNMLHGGGTAYQWGQTYEISEDEALPGDLVFMQPPNSAGVNHTGIYIGKDGAGKNLYVHCAGGQGVVVNSFRGFKYFRRAVVNFGDEVDEEIEN